jgi:hypothetical protein
VGCNTKVLITWNKELRRFQISSNEEVTVYQDTHSAGGLKGVQFSILLTLSFSFFPSVGFLLPFIRLGKQ